MPTPWDRGLLSFDLLDQTQLLVFFRPGVQVRLRKTAPPNFVSVSDHPIWMSHHCLRQPISSLFFRWYSGSGAGDPMLARFHPIPIRFSVSRIVSSLTNAAVSPSAKLVSAASCNVHILVSWPYLRGLWCNSSFNFSAFSPAKGGPGLMWPTRAFFQYRQSSLIEPFDHISHGFIITPQRARYGYRVVTPFTCQKNLAASQYERIACAQFRFQLFTFVFC